MAPRREADEGFSLVELVVVMTILAILASVALASFLRQRDAAREAALASDLRNASLFQLILAAEGRPVDSLQDLIDAGFRYSEGIVELEDADIFGEEPEPCVQGRAVGRPDHVQHLRPSHAGQPRHGPCPQ